MTYILVLQWSGSTEADFDGLIAMEDLLLAELPEAHGLVDGHDFGSGEMNIFVHTELPLEAFADVMSTLGSHSRWADVRAAYRGIDSDDFVLLWPKTLEHFDVS